jgi:hypothetical protein
MPEQVGLGNVAERLVQTGPLRSRLFLRPRTLDGDVQEARGALVAADLVNRAAVDPSLLVYEIGTVAAELAGVGGL